MIHSSLAKCRCAKNRKGQGHSHMSHSTWQTTNKQKNISRTDQRLTMLHRSHHTFLGIVKSFFGRDKQKRNDMSIDLSKKIWYSLRLNIDNQQQQNLIYCAIQIVDNWSDRLESYMKYLGEIYYFDWFNTERTTYSFIVWPRRLNFGTRFPGYCQCELLIYARNFF